LVQNREVRLLKRCASPIEPYQQKWR
jgi:hypothetical protein